jgi:hypothetical protein
VKEKTDLDQEEESEEESSQSSVDAEVLSSKSLTSNEDDFQPIPTKKSEPINDSKKILEELEQSNSSESSLSQDSA